MIRVCVICLFVLYCVCANKSIDDTGKNDFIKQLLTEPLEPQNNHSCLNSNSPLNNFHFRGTALGGWLVLEPWITPSLFYQFLGCSSKWGTDAIQHVAIDSYTFCTALGKEEANRQLRNHWATWVTEDQIANLAKLGVRHIRLPVADWMYIPYEPYIGCWDGALEEVERVLALCEKYNLEVLIDLHAVKGSQNGLDNSGTTGHYYWKTINATVNASQVVQYDHWDIRGGDWVGPFNTTSRTYTYVNHTHIMQTLNVINIIIDTYKNYSIVIGIEPINEPWQYTPMDILQEFYWRAYLLVQAKVPRWVTLLHDSFRLNPLYWGNANLTHPLHGGSGFLQNCNNYAVDSHIYQAWANDFPIEWFEQRVCEDSFNLKYMESIGVPVVVGEWSLATNNCAMWLNGFNDNVPGYPKVECERVTCPKSYLNSKEYTQPGTPLDSSLPAQDPFGTGGPSYVEYGTCPIDRPFPNDTLVMYNLSYAMLHTYDYYTHGQFFWNFRTELESRWDYQKAVGLGWIPTDWESAETKDTIADICVNILNSIPIPPLANDDDSVKNVHSLVLLEHSISAAIIFLIIFGAVYFIVLAFRGRFAHYLEGYQGIEDQSTTPEGSPVFVLYPNNQRMPVSTIQMSNGDVELARRRDDSIRYPTRGNANHISPYQSAIVIPQHHGPTIS